MATKRPTYDCSTPTLVEGARKEIARLKAEKRELESERYFRAEVVPMLAAQVDDWERTARSDLARAIADLAAGGKRSGLLVAGVRGETREYAATALLGPLLVLLCGKDRVSEVLTLAAQVVPEGPSLAERKKRLEKVSEELDFYELQEERFISIGEREGIRIPRRADARPEIVLHPNP